MGPGETPTDMVNNNQSNQGTSSLFRFKVRMLSQVQIYNIYHYMSSRVQTTLRLMEHPAANSKCVNNIRCGQTHSARWHDRWRRWWHRWCWCRASTRRSSVNTNQQLLLLTEDFGWRRDYMGTTGLALWFCLMVSVILMMGDSFYVLMFSWPQKIEMSSQHLVFQTVILCKHCSKL